MNPLLDIDARTDLGAIEPGHVRSGIPALLDGQRRALAALCDAPTPTWALVADLDRASARLAAASSAVAVHRMTLDAPDLEAAWDDVFADIEAASSELWSDARLLSALERLDTSGLTEEERRHIHWSTQSLRCNGAGLAPADRERLVAIDSALAAQTLAWSRAVQADTLAWHLDVTDESTLRGLPGPLLDGARQRAEAAGCEGWRFALDAPTYRGILQSAEDPQLRETLWRAWCRRGAESNPERIRRIVLLRRERAALLGFAGYTDLVTHDRMAGNAETVESFLGSLTQHARAFMEKEDAQLEAAEGRTLSPWDVAYASQRLKRSEHAIDDAKLQPWFPLPHVLDGVFTIARRLFGVEVVASPGGGWASDVRSYSLVDEDGEQIGRFHLDLHPRAGKRAGAWMSGIASGCVSAPLAIVCGNMTSPTREAPALLTHREVVTLLHEFGHLLHFLLSRSPTRLLWGTAVPRDFVELPSQLMEEWAWTPEGLQLLSAHVETGEPLQISEIQALLGTRSFRAGAAMMRQLSFATLDIALHEDWEPDDDLLAFANAVDAGFTTWPKPAEHAMVCSFGHLFSHPTGYAGGYYVYKWAEVLSVDAFGAFAEAGIFDATTGRRFRTEVLQRGNTVDVLDQFVAFRGREPSLEPLLARLG